MGKGDAAGSSEAEGNLSEVTARELTADEINLAKEVYGDNLDYDQVTVLRGKYTPIQPDNSGVTLKNTIHATGDAYVDNYASASLEHQGFFIHELGHVYQFQQGISVGTRGFFLHTFGRIFGDPYKYRFREGKAFGSYNIEQQGDILKHHFYRSLRGINRSTDFLGRSMASPSQLQGIVSGEFN